MISPINQQFMTVPQQPQIEDQLITPPDRRYYICTEMEVVIGGHFKIVRKIGAGAFGEIFEAVNIKRGHQVAIKLENCESKNQQLLHEAKVLADLMGSDVLTDKGIPNLYAKGKEG